jgi:hypothetical protein
MTSAANTSPEKKREGGATPPSPTPSPVRTILVGLGAAGLVLALIIGLGRIGSGDHIATPTLEEIDPGMLAFERDMQALQDLLNQIEAGAAPAASGAAQTFATATPKE